MKEMRMMDVLCTRHLLPLLPHLRGMVGDGSNNNFFIVHIVHGRYFDLYPSGIEFFVMRLTLQKLRSFSTALAQLSKLHKS